MIRSLEIINQNVINGERTVQESFIQEFKALYNDEEAFFDRLPCLKAAAVVIPAFRQQKSAYLLYALSLSPFFT